MAWLPGKRIRNGRSSGCNGGRSDRFVDDAAPDLLWKERPLAAALLWHRANTGKWADGQTTSWPLQFPFPLFSHHHHRHHHALTPVSQRPHMIRGAATTRTVLPTDDRMYHESMGVLQPTTTAAKMENPDRGGRLPAGQGRKHTQPLTTPDTVTKGCISKEAVRVHGLAGRARPCHTQWVPTQSGVQVWKRPRPSASPISVHLRLYAPDWSDVQDATANQAAPSPVSIRRGQLRPQHLCLEVK